MPTAEHCTREVRVLADCGLALDKRVSGALPRLVGYAALFNKSTELFPGLRETVAPGAFTRTLEEGADVKALFNHNPDIVLGRNKAGTLTLEENTKGLKVNIQPPDTETGRGVVESVRRGDVSQMSFAFEVVEVTEKDVGDGWWERTLVDVELSDVSLVTYPAYPDTTIAARSWEERKAKMQSAERKKVAQVLSIASERQRLDIHVLVEREVKRTAGNGQT